MVRKIVCDKEGERLDVYLARQFNEDYSRSQIKKLVEAGKVKVNGRNISAHYSVKAGDKIEMEAVREQDDSMGAEDIPLDILYEDDELIVVNKPAGMVVHPAQGNLEHTLVNALLHHTRHLSKSDNPARPGIVHRLDKDTSGVLVIAKNNKTHEFLARQFKKHTVHRVYFTFVDGVVQHDEGICEEPVGRAFLSRKKNMVRPSGGKHATTYYKVLKRFKNETFLEIQPKTGRTHQIRVHMSHLGHPVLGDKLYGSESAGIKRQALHAAELGFVHPKTQEEMFFKSPLPQDMKDLRTYLESRK